MLSVILLLITLTLLAVSIYQLRIIKRINEKHIKLVSPERDIRRIAKAQSDASWEHYRQSEYYAQLINLALITLQNMQAKRRNFLHPTALPMLIFVLHLLHHTHQVLIGMTCRK